MLYGNGNGLRKTSAFSRGNENYTIFHFTVLLASLDLTKDH